MLTDREKHKESATNGTGKICNPVGTVLNLSHLIATELQGKCLLLSPIIDYTVVYSIRAIIFLPQFFAFRTSPIRERSTKFTKAILIAANSTW
jgi:hypothetical protein